MQDTKESRKILADRLDEINNAELKALIEFLLSNSSDMALCAAEIFFYIHDKSWENVWKNEQLAINGLENLWFAVFGEVPGELVINNFVILHL